MVLHPIATAIAIPGSFILAGHTLAFSGALAAIRNQDSSHIATNIWLRNVRFFFPTMISTVTSYAYLSYCAPSLTWDTGVLEVLVRPRAMYTIAGGMVFASGVVTKIWLLPLFEPIMAGDVDLNELSVGLRTAGLRNWSRVVLCGLGGFLGLLGLATQISGDEI